MKRLPSLLLMSCGLTLLPFSVNAIEHPKANQAKMTTVISFPATAIKAPSHDVIRAEHTLKVNKQLQREPSLRFIPGQGATQQSVTNVITTQSFYWRQ